MFQPLLREHRLVVERAHKLEELLHRGVVGARTVPRVPRQRGHPGDVVGELAYLLVDTHVRQQPAPRLGQRLWHTGFEELLEFNSSQRFNSALLRETPHFVHAKLLDQSGLSHDQVSKLVTT